MKQKPSCRWCRTAGPGLLLVVSLLCPATLWSATFEALGRWPGPWREPAKLHVQGDLAYVGTGQGLLILNISNPAQPNYASHLDCAAGGTTDVYADGDHVYLAAGSQPLRVVNVADPVAPSLVTETSVGDRYVNAVYVHGDYAYLSEGAKGLGLVKIQPPETSVYQLTHTPDAWGRIEIVGHLGYVPTLTGMQIMDFTNPGERAPRGSVDLGARAEGVAVRGSYAYLPLADGLHVIGVNDPDNPVERGVYATSHGVKAVRVVGETAYICVGTTTQSTLQALSLGSPTEPSFLGEFPIQGGHQAMEVHLGHVLLVSRFAGANRMDVVDFSDPGAPAWVTAWENPGPVLDLSVSAETVLAACGEAGLKVIDATDASAPQLAGSYVPVGGGSVLCVKQSGVLAGLGASDGFRLLDLSDPAQPELTATYPTMMGPVQLMDIVGDRAYLSAGFGMGEFEVLDISDPTAPTRLGGTPVFDAFDLAVAPNGVAFLAAGLMDLQLFDTSQDGDPTPLPSYGGVPGVYALEVRTESEDLLVYLAGQDGLAIVQFNEPTQPQMVGQWVHDGANLGAVALAGNRAYVANSQQLWAVDITDPSSPAVLAEHPLGASGMGASGDRLYALLSGGLVILQLGESVAAPSLAYQTQGGALVLDWSAAGGGGWVLQRNGDLLDPQGWETVAGTDTTTQWQADMDAVRRFFRLMPASP